MTGHRSAARILTLDQILAQPDVEPLVPGVINAGEIGMLFGDPGAGKSFIALALGLAVAGGEHWAGRKATEGTVLYCALEGLAGFRDRIPAALGKDTSGKVRDRFFAIGSGVDLSSAVEATRLVSAIEEKIPEKPSLLVIDTLHRAAPGSDENSAQDMGALIASCDTIREKFGTAVLLVHHSRKASDTYRGSTALHADVDVMMKATKTEADSNPRVVLTSLKVKDGEPFGDITFEMVPVSLGVSRWGTERRSIRLVETDPVSTALSSLAAHGWSRSVRDAWPALDAIVRYTEVEPLSTNQLAEHLEVSAATARRRASELIRAGYVQRRKVRGYARLFPTPRAISPTGGSDD